MSGSGSNAPIGEQTTVRNEDGRRTELETLEVLNKILIQLENMNLHMAVLTDEEFTCE